MREHFRVPPFTKNAKDGAPTPLVVAGGPPLTTIYVQRFYRGCPTLAFFARVGGDDAYAIGFVT